MSSRMDVGLHLYIFRINKVLNIFSKLFKSVNEIFLFFYWWESARYKVVLLIQDWAVRRFLACRKTRGGRLLFDWESLRVVLISAHVLRREGNLTRRPQLFILLCCLRTLFENFLRTWTSLVSWFVRIMACLSLCIHLDWVGICSKCLTHSAFFFVRWDYVRQVKLDGLGTLWTINKL